MIRNRNIQPLSNEHIRVQNALSGIVCLYFILLRRVSSRAISPQALRLKTRAGSGKIDQ